MAYQHRVNATQRRKFRVRNKIKEGKATDRLRLSVHKSSKHIYAQVIDDKKGETVVAASTVDKELRSKLKSTGTVEAATKVGELLAERAKKAGVKKVVFDRGSFLYHGRIKAVADGAREGGIDL